MSSIAPTFTLSNFPSWQSTPALALARPPSLLMAIDKGSSNRELAGVDDTMYSEARSRNQSTDTEVGDHGESTHPVIRIKPASRPRSFLHILEDFQEESLQVTPSPSTSHFSAQTDKSVDAVSASLQPNLRLSGGPSAQSVTSFSSAATSLPSPVSRNEDTTRRKQRFSLPIVGLQTTPVTARANTKGEGLAKRVSLVLGVGRTIRGPKSTCVDGSSSDQGTEGGTVKQSRSTGHGVAASRLADLLGRRKEA
jgi:FYVE/RhoGEF/PH domain-containing protein 5/6